MVSPTPCPKVQTCFEATVLCCCNLTAVSANQATSFMPMHAHKLGQQRAKQAAINLRSIYSFKQLVVVDTFA
jgi:hypothetical protein